jgi:hypothetical protein
VAIQSGRDRLILDLLAKAPADRPSSMLDVEFRLRELLDAMELPQPPRPLASITGRTATIPPTAVGKSGERSKTAEVAKLALVKRPTPQAAVEVATPRSVSRIDTLTPESIRIESTRRPPVSPAADERPSPDEPQPAARLAKPSTDRAVRSSTGAPTAPQPGAVRFATGSEPGRAAEPRDRSQVASDVKPPATGSSPALLVPEATAEPPALEAGPSAVPPHPAIPTPGPEPTASARARRSRMVVGALGVALAAVIGLFELRRDRVAPPAPAAPASEIKIKFVSAPPGAMVRMIGTGETLGVTPFTRSFARSDRSVTFEFAKSGFAAVTQDITLATDDAVAATLAQEVGAPPREPRPPAAAAPPPAPPTAAKQDRPRGVVPARPSPPPPSDRPVDRNATIDVFQRK